MEITCPACAKKNEASDACVRCACDLSSLRSILSAAMRHLWWAKLELQMGDWRAALDHAERSWELAHSQESARLAGLAAAAQGELPALTQWRGRAGAPPA